MATLLLVDGHAYAYRAFHAIRGLRAPDGLLTNAVFGFIKMLSRMRSVVNPSHLAVVWDGGLSDQRMEILPAYKAQRPAMPDDLQSQLAGISAFLEAARVAAFQMEGVEADDLIATLAGQAAGAGEQVVIASADKDFFQLISPSIRMLNPGDKSETLWTAEQVVAKTGVRPDQIVDYLSLIGDAVDNIPGVRGIGPKTAAALLNQFGSLDSLFARLPEVASARLREALASSLPEVRRNQRMIRLRSDQPGTRPLADLVVQTPDNARLHALYVRWGFRSLAAEVAPAPGGQRDLFAAR